MILVMKCYLMRMCANLLCPFISASERKKNFCRAQVPRLLLVRYFLALTWRWSNVFPRLALCVCFRWLNFPALGADYVFLAHGASYVCSRAWQWLHVFLCLPLVTFAALFTLKTTTLKSIESKLTLTLFPNPA